MAAFSGSGRLTSQTKNLLVVTCLNMTEYHEVVCAKSCLECHQIQLAACTDDSGSGDCPPALMCTNKWCPCGMHVV